MKRRTRKCPPGVLIHCYQNTLDGVLIFYTLSDYLVCFTFICTYARRYSIRIISVCFMPDHIHLCVIAPSRRRLSAFIRDYSKTYAHMHNVRFQEKGQLFNHPFGSAPKVGAKKARTLLAYIANNPVERQLTQQAEDYRWNFLAYASSDHPFSEELVVRRASIAMKKALAEIKAMAEASKPLSYNFLQRIVRTLDERETRQLVDFIVTTYSVIEYDYAIRFFDTQEKMVLAFHSNTGSEYDLNEVFVGKTDVWYNKLTKTLLKKLSVKDIRDIFRLSEDQRFNLLKMLMRETDCPPAQICKYLHLRVKR